MHEQIRHRIALTIGVLSKEDNSICQALLDAQRMWERHFKYALRHFKYVLRHFKFCAVGGSDESVARVTAMANVWRR